MVGKFTYLGTNYVSDVDIELDKEIYRAIDTVDGVTEILGEKLNLLGFFAIFGTGGGFDLKNFEGNELWGYYYDKETESNQRWNWAYIYKGQLIRYDAPGNILAAAAARRAEISYNTLRLGAWFAGTVDSIKRGKLKIGDDKLDSSYLDWGYSIDLP